MKQLFAAVLILFSIPAFAHVELGTYKGTTAAGEPCELKANKLYFENDVKHPLNERVEVEFNGQKFVVGHPPVVNADYAIASFNHDMFQGILPTSVGAQALVINKVEKDDKDYMAAATLITHEYRADKRSKIVCENLKLN